MVRGLHFGGGAIRSNMWLRSIGRSQFFYQTRRAIASNSGRRAEPATLRRSPKIFAVPVIPSDNDIACGTVRSTVK